MNTTTTTTAASAAAGGDGSATERIAWWFYSIAATGSSIGQIWVGVATPPWPHALPWWTRVILVLPFAVVIDLGGVVTSAFADWRQRLGEAAYGWRALSIASVTVGVAINILGHHTIPYLAVVFGGLGLFAYTVWLLHAAARRRDALRRQGLLGRPAPTYGPAQWKREPEVTRRARDLALRHGLGLHDSLDTARRELAAERERDALAKHLTTLLRARHDDANLANILVAAIPADRLAAEVAALVDIPGWARMIAADLQPATPAPAAGTNTPAPDTATAIAMPATEPRPGPGPGPGPGLGLGLGGGEPRLDPEREPDAPPEEAPDTPGANTGGANTGGDMGAGLGQPETVLREIPSRAEEYTRWHQLWQQIRGDNTSSATLARRHAVSQRTLQRVRQAGQHGLLDDPLPLAQRRQPPAQRVITRVNGYPADTLTHS